MTEPTDLPKGMDPLLLEKVGLANKANELTESRDRVRPCGTTAPHVAHVHGRWGGGGFRTEGPIWIESSCEGVAEPASPDIEADLGPVTAEIPKVTS